MSVFQFECYKLISDQFNNELGSAVTVSDVHFLELLVQLLRVGDGKVVLGLQVVFVELDIVGALGIDISVWLVLVVPLLWS